MVFKMASRLTLAALLIFAISCKTSSQKADEIFGDRTDLPKALDAIANPQPPASVSAREAAKANQKGRVSVAVIDNGTDYLHPDLINQIKFDIEGGRVVGTGLDVMGNDRWPHSNLIRAEIFSFGAREIKNQRIFGANANPLRMLSAMNQLYVDHVLAAVAATPELAGTLFQKKLTKESITIFQVIPILKAGFDIKRYNEQKKNGFLLTPQTVEDKEKAVKAETVRDVVTNPWALAANVLPSTFNANFARIDGADVMFKLLETVTRKFNSQYRWDKYYSTFETYYTTRQTMFPQETFQQLYSHWYSESTGSAGKDPRRDLATSFCKLLDSETFAKISDPKYAPSAREKYVDALINKTIETMISYSQFVLKVSKDDDDRQAAQIFIEVAPTLNQIYKQFISSPERVMMFCDGKANPKTEDPKILDYANQRGGSLLDPGSANETHGTHTAGIIARQSSRINIVPVRVVTSTPEYTDLTGTRIRQSVEQQFAVWLQNPIILKGVLARLGSIASASSAGGALGVLREYLDDQFKSQYLDFYFFDEILKSIEYVGAKKIKIASMSLGTEFNKSVETGLKTSRKAQMREAMRFLVYEFFKFVVAEQLEKHASKTLFVIAAGNSSQWVDGNTRSALPCDLSSPYFAEVETAFKNRGARTTGPVATAPATTSIPNNRIKNILCVGSLNSKEELSSFTNLPLTGIPFVLSYGEAILSPIKTSSCDGVEQQYINKFGPEVGGAMVPMPAYSGPSEEVFDEFYIKMGWLKKDAPQFEKMMARTDAMIKIMNWSALTGSIQSVAKMKMCLDVKAPRARMSGTSMATPVVAGFIGRAMSAYLYKMNLHESEAYDHPDYSPGHIIDLLIQKSPTFGGASLIKDVRKIVRIRQWKDLNAEQTGRVLSMPAVSIREISAP